MRTMVIRRSPKLVVLIAKTIGVCMVIIAVGMVAAVLSGSDGFKELASALAALAAILAALVVDPRGSE